MTKARIQPFCRANNINLGFYSEDRVFPRSVTNRDSALYLYNIHFCLIWKSHGVSFNQAITELKKNFKYVDYFITEENVNSHFEYIHKPKKIDSHLSSFVVYDLETHNTDRARPYVFCFYRLSKLAGKYNRDLTSEERKKCKKDTIAFDGDDCVEKALDFCLKIKREEYRDKKGKFSESNLQLHAHNGSGFDTWIVLNSLSCDKRIVNIIKNGNGIFDLKVFNGYIQSKTSTKQIPQFLDFRCGMTHLNYSLEKLGKTFKLQKELLKTKMNHDNVYNYDKYDII